MKVNVLLSLLMFGLANCQSQTKAEIQGPKTNQEVSINENLKIHVDIHARVDTTQDEIREIATLWTNYLNSEPDKISDNPYWNEEEKKLYRDFDLSRTSLYQLPSDQLLNYFKPKILSIEKEGEHYGIRTIFSAEGLEGEYAKSNPWAIQKIYAVKENGEWRLKNALPVITANWNRRTVGKITFIYSQEHDYSDELAKKANEFCNQIIEEFGLDEWQPFDYYITPSGDEMGQLLNFDFFFAGYTTGKGLHEHRILISGVETEYFPHEFIHLILPKFERHYLIEEGFATWKGGTGQKTFEENARLFANALSKNDAVTFSDVLKRRWGAHCAAFYVTGAILCNSAYKKGGVRLVKELLEIPNDDEKLVESLCEVFDFEKEELDMYWRKEAMKFAGK